MKAILVMPDLELRVPLRELIPQRLIRGVQQEMTKDPDRVLNLQRPARVQRHLVEQRHHQQEAALSQVAKDQHQAWRRPHLEAARHKVAGVRHHPEAAHRQVAGGLRQA